MNKTSEMFEDVKRIVAENAHTHEGQITVKALGAITWYCRSVKQYVDVCTSYKCNCPAPKQQVHIRFILKNPMRIGRQRKMLGESYEEDPPLHRWKK